MAKKSQREVGRGKYLKAWRWRNGLLFLRASNKGLRLYVSQEEDALFIIETLIKFFGLAPADIDPNVIAIAYDLEMTGYFLSVNGEEFRPPNDTGVWYSRSDAMKAYEADRQEKLKEQEKE